MAGAGRRGSGRTRGGGTDTQRRRTSRPAKKELIPVLAGIAREVDDAVQRTPTRPGVRTKFQVVALLVREERARAMADTTLTQAKRSEQLKRLDGVATQLARIAARDQTLLALLAEDAKVSDAAHAYKASVMRAGGMEPPDEPEPEPAAPPTPQPGAEKRVVPQSVLSRRLANPFLAPDYEGAAQRVVAKPRRLAGWELLEPLFRSFEDASPGAPACMTLPEPRHVPTPPGRELMPHQSQVVAAAGRGHRTFLLADEPGLGKTAQALLAAQAADAFPLLVVAPNVVKTNWAHEVGLWTPLRQATVVHGDGEQVDAFADVVIVNYDILDRHAGWLGDHGFRGMVVDEAHFIKNTGSQRSRHVLEISERIRARTARPLLMALTGTPLINDIEDFRAIWQFLGWIDATKPLGSLLTSLEDTGLTPADRGFSAAARSSVVEMGIVRRRKTDVAKDIPARRVADLPVELDGAVGRSIRAAEAALAQRLVGRYRAAVEARGTDVLGVDPELARRVAAAELKDSSSKANGENVFTMVRRIGQAKAGLAADYAAQLARNVGKVVFFAKHVDVMDHAEKTFAERGISYTSIRGDQTPRARAKAVAAFTEDPEVQIVVCSLMAAGVGLNLQVASNLVLAELSWTDAEQTQAIDRIHRIGQEEPVTAWRVIAAQTIDARIAELIDSKSGLAARALDGASEDDSVGSHDVQLDALVGLLTDALAAEDAAGDPVIAAARSPRARMRGPLGG
ncbi:helicase domain protein [Cellulomonas flavigena DSM 20109]|uniref:Helicase domain protein n=1 Tax=Cellulomonas flavigena (strain ATCC 482 / DSM 20109 / BCRC 11376 / JCM 18109 / NBRC 3775 / NCIMB 8073 / NRS 134) TaxID=446466 RepID=D5UJX8_CELFN|nr:DEAD/DEAH box helicase [Cellulomonas flavigena]ADG73720.1 helicase domain protein [Cellulomonas flavigena DSM 20109]